MGCEERSHGVVLSNGYQLHGCGTEIIEPDHESQGPLCKCFYKVHGWQAANL